MQMEDLSTNMSENSIYQITQQQPAPSRNYKKFEKNTQTRELKRLSFTHHCYSKTE